MKKVSIIVLYVAFLCLMSIFSACSKDGEYRTNVYENIPDYKGVNCNVLKNDDIELHVEKSVSDSKAEIEKLFNVIRSDYSALEDAFDLNTKIKCYVISDENILGHEKAVYQNNVLLCGKNSVTAGEYKTYRTALTGAYIRSTEFWKQYGARAYVFGGEYDNEELKRYYENGNDTELTLFAAYFLDEFSDNTDIAIKTAYSFGDFVIKNYGYDEFIKANLTDYRTEYLGFLGVNRNFATPFDLSFLDGAEYSRKFFTYPLVIRTANRIYNLDAFSAKRETASFDTPERVLYHLSAGNTECEKILNYIKENAPESYDFVSERYAEALEYFVSDGETRTRCDVTGRKIYLLDPSEFVHETIHAITLRTNPTDEAWIAEGVAEYLSRYVSRHVSDINNRFYLSFTDKTLTGSLADFVNEVNSLYENNGGKFDNLNDFDFALLEKCIGETTLKNGDYKSKIRFPYATDPIYEFYACTSKDGNVLTYPEAYAFTYYLIEEYGFDKVLGCCVNYNLKNVFGSDYNALMNEFINHIS